MYGVRNRSVSPIRYNPLSNDVKSDAKNDLDDNKESDYHLSINQEKYTPLLQCNIDSDDFSKISAQHIVHNNLSCLYNIRELTLDEYQTLANCFELLWDKDIDVTNLDDLFRITCRAPNSYKTVPRAVKAVSFMLGVAGIVIALNIVGDTLHYSFGLNNSEIFAGINTVCILLILSSLALIYRYINPNLLGGVNDTENKRLMRKITLNVFKSISQALLKNNLNKPDLLDKLGDLLGSL
jgi:hypothetical protein